jgi:DnaJ family protein C protein 8
LIHPDKCKLPKATDAFHVVEQAYKTLENPEKRNIYQRIMREARERTEYERKKENKRRKKKG